MRRSLIAIGSVAALGAGALLQAQQGAQNEGRAQPGPRLVIERNLEFVRAGGQPLRLDLYRADPTPTPNPVVVWIHGSEAPFNSRSLTPASGGHSGIRGD